MRIAITGVPATGKTTVAKLLAKKLGLEYVDLNKLAEEKNLYTGYDKKRQVKVVDVEKIDRELKDKDNVVLDSHYSHLLSVDKVIVLRLNTKELRKRLEKRGYPESKIMENLQAEIMEVIESDIEEGWRIDKRKSELSFRKRKPRTRKENYNTRTKKIKIIQIDTTNKKPDKIVDEIKRKLKL